PFFVNFELLEDAVAAVSRTIPSRKDLVVPVLRALKELGGAARAKEVQTKVAERLKISDSVMDETTPGGQPLFYKEVAWTRQYLVENGYLDGSKHGVWQLTEKGRNTDALTDEDIQ